MIRYLVLAATAVLVASACTPQEQVETADQPAVEASDIDVDPAAGDAEIEELAPDEANNVQEGSILFVRQDADGKEVSSEQVPLDEMHMSEWNVPLADVDWINPVYQVTGEGESMMEILLYETSASVDEHADFYENALSGFAREDSELVTSLSGKNEFGENIIVDITVIEGDPNLVAIRKE